jgi:hypothetical protein
LYRSNYWGNRLARRNPALMNAKQKMADGRQLLFVLWYITPREILERNDRTDD